MEIFEIEELRQANSQRKIHGSFRYATNKAHKANERIRTASFQKIADRYKKNSKLLAKKKMKGQTMPTAMALNSRCAKGWSRYGGFKESFKSFAIWEIT